MARTRCFEVPALCGRAGAGRAVDPGSRGEGFRCSTRRGATGRLPRTAVWSALLLLLAAPARAELLGWDGTLSLDYFSSDPLLRHWELSGRHAAVAEGPLPALGALHLAGGISDAATLLVTDPDALVGGVAAVRLSATLGIGTLSPLPPLPFGQLLEARQLPVFGSLRLCLVTPDCIDDLSLVSFFQGQTRALGVGGTLAGSLPGGTRLSVQAAPWTLGTATAAVDTGAGGTATAFAFGFVHGPASGSGSSGASGGELQLVTPMRAVSAAAPGLSGFGRLRLHFVPEPGELLLLAAGLASLLVLARRRTRT
jgi:hypothetical protein